MEIITRKEAFIKNLPFYFTGKPCKRRHIEKRRTSNGDCIVCGRIIGRIADKKRSPEKIRIKRHKAYHKDIEKTRQKARENWATNDHRREQASEYRKTPKAKELKKAREQKYRTNSLYKAIKNYHSTLRRHFKRKALPKWSNTKIIKKIYKACAQFSKDIGIIYHVDHIYPLKMYRDGEWVACGLHVENNLRIISAPENISKSCREPFKKELQPYSLDLL